MQADARADASFASAFGQIVKRITESLRKTPASTLPIRMFVFGGAAMHFYTGERVSNDIDATFSHRILLPDDLEFAYRSPDGAARLLYFDRQFSDTFSLLHEDAYDESVALELTDIDSSILDVRLLSALDLAVSKISRLAGHDCDDIAALARHNLIESEALRRRAEEAAKNYMETWTGSRHRLNSLQALWLTSKASRQSPFENSSPFACCGLVIREPQTSQNEGPGLSCVPVRSQSDRIYCCG